MKNLQNVPTVIARVMAVFALVFVSTLTWAQDKGLDIDVNVDKGGDWYANPIVWVVAVAVFILLLVALMRNGGKTGA